LDGCTFDVGRLPNLPIKLALLNKTYEDLERRAVLQYVRPELPVIELGACIGVVSCITNKLLNNPKAHVVVEANPNVLPHLNENRAANRCEFEILNAAIAYDKNSVTFTPSTDFWESSLERKNSSEPVTVETVRLGDIVSQRNFKSFTLICDIEGYEYDLVSHEADVLANADTIILETHARMIGEPKTVELLDTLQQLGFRTVLQDALVYVLRRSPDAN
jgi:FkbM family methyltransferase